jgi:[acyl-carrier-protein] S-malonyltransferase
MGGDLAERFPAVAELYREADDTLGFPLSRLCFSGDADELTETRNAQPAILMHSVAVLHVLRSEAGIEPAIAAGHSLGEYSALVAAGSLSAMDALRIVRKRGELMFAAGREQPGTMAAVLGLKRAEVEQVCAESSGDDGVAVIANVNAPGQIVISGHHPAIERAAALARERGARKTIPLKVSGAFHSPLVGAAQQELVEYFDRFTFRNPSIGVVCNVDASVIHDAGTVTDALSRQLTNPVLWSDSMRTLAEAWDGRILEAGPGTVLAGLMKRIDRSRGVESAGTAEELERLIAAEVELA